MRIGILSAQLSELDNRENRRFAREILLLGHRAVIINYRDAVIVTTKNKQVLYQPNRQGILRPVRVHAVIPRINEADSKSINLGTLALECLIAGGAYSTASPSAIRLSKDKTHSLLAMSSAGITTPRTAAISTSADKVLDLEKVLKVVEPTANRRLIIKTNIGTGGKGVMPANSRGEARAIVEGFLSNSIPILLQQFIEPTKKDHYIDFRIYVINGKYAGTMIREATRPGEVRANIDLGGKAIFYQPTQEEIKMAEAACEAVGLTIAGVDIIPSGNKRFVIEVNSSPGFAFEEITGTNLVKRMARQAIAGVDLDQVSAPTKIKEVLNTPVPIPTPKVIRKARPKISKALSPEAIKQIRIKVKSISE